MITPGLCKIEGFIKIHDPKTGEVLVDKKNAVHYENISISLAQTLADRGTGYIYQMAFGNGGSSVDPTGVITYTPTWVCRRNCFPSFHLGMHGLQHIAM